MRNHLLILMGLLLSPLVVAQESPSEFMTRWVESYNENKGEVMASFYENSPQVDCLISAGISYRGFKEIRQMYLDDMKSARFYDSKSEKMRHRMLADNVAVVSFHHHLKYEIQDQNQHCQVRVRTTVTLRRVGKLWKIVSEHSSAMQGVPRVEFIEAPAEPEPDDQAPQELLEFDGLDEDQLRELLELNNRAQP